MLACGFFIFLGLWLISESMDRIAEAMKENKIDKQP